MSIYVSQLSEYISSTDISKSFVFLEFNLPDKRSNLFCNLFILNTINSLLFFDHIILGIYISEFLPISKS